MRFGKSEEGGGRGKKTPGTPNPGVGSGRPAPLARAAAACSEPRRAVISSGGGRNPSASTPYKVARARARSIVSAFSAVAGSIRFSYAHSSFEGCDKGSGAFREGLLTPSFDSLSSILHPRSSTLRSIISNSHVYSAARARVLLSACG